MSGLRRNESNRFLRDPGGSERLIGLQEAAEILELAEEDVRIFVSEGKIPAYKIGGEFLRFRKGQVEALRSRLRLLKHQSTPIYHLIPPKPLSKARYSLFDRIRDFLYFNDFYILASVLIALLLAVILIKK